MASRDEIRILFDGTEMQLLHLPGRAGFSLVTFDIMHGRANGRAGFAMKLALKRGLDLYAIVPRRPNWYPASEALRCAELVRAAKDRPSLGYGASMGGYGVLKYGAALGIDAALAMSPQSTIDPAEIGTRDPRYHGYFDAEAHHDMRVRESDRPPIAYAACDPLFPFDVAQRDLLDPGVVRIDLPHMGHHSCGAMTPSDNALARFDEALQGQTRQLRAALLSSSKETLQHAIGHIRRDLAEGDADLAYHRVQAACRRFGHDHTLVFLLGKACLASGRTREGIDAMAPLVSQRPDQILYRRLLADLHEASGDIGAAVAQMSKAVGSSGNPVLARKLQRLKEALAGRSAIEMRQAG